MAIAYRYYSAFLAARVAALDDERTTPAHTEFDGHNYYPMGRWTLFGHHFAAITGAGPLIGPVLAAQFGFLPGLVWLVIGVCLGGAVHDFMILWASTRHDGRSLAEIARAEMGSVAGVTTSLAILFIIVIALAGLGLAVVNALRDRCTAWRRTKRGQRTGIGRERRSYSARSTVRVRWTPQPSLLRRGTAAAAERRSRNSPKTAEPLPDIAAAIAPASRRAVFVSVISGWRRAIDGSRSLIICAARDGHGIGSTCRSRAWAYPAARSSSYQPYASRVETPNGGITSTIQCDGRSTSG